METIKNYSNFEEINIDLQNNELNQEDQIKVQKKMKITINNISKDKQQLINEKEALESQNLKLQDELLMNKASCKQAYRKWMLYTQKIIDQFEAQLKDLQDKQSSQTNTKAEEQSIESNQQSNLEEEIKKLIKQNDVLKSENIKLKKEQENQKLEISTLNEQILQLQDNITQQQQQANQEKSLNLQESPTEEQVYVNDVQWLLNQKRHLYKLIAKSLFKQFDRTKCRMLEKSNFDRAVCEIFTNMNEAEPPLEITLQWFQSHDKLGQGSIALKDFQHTVAEILELIFTEKQKRKHPDFLQWNFVGKISKEELKKLARAIYQSVSRSSPGLMNEGEFDHGICLLAEKLNTRAPDLKLTRMLQKKYKLETDQINQKKFVNVVKKLCGFGDQLLLQELQSKRKIRVELEQIDNAILTEIQLYIEKQGQKAKGRIMLNQFNCEGKHQLNWKFESFQPIVQLKGEIEFL